MARVYLVGFMGAGKSTIAKKLGNLLGYEIVDLDYVFEEKYKISIKTFFQKYDEALFRSLESKILKSTYKMNNVVISTGGGTPCFYDSIDKMNENGITVYLKMSVPSLVNRLQHAKRPRPLIETTEAESLNEFVVQKLKDRSPYYNKAQIEVDGENIDYEELSRMIKERSKDVV